MITTNDEQVLEIFRRTGAYLEGHFRLTSGLHSPNYMQCALVLQHPKIAEKMGQMLAAELRKHSTLKNINLVVSPAIGGLIIGQEVARAFNARHIFSERVDGKMTLRRGFLANAADSAVVVEDVITTGGSSREVVELLQSRGVTVLGAGSIIDRSGGRADLGVPRVALATLQIVTYSPESCPLCAKGGEATKPGSRG